MHNKQHPSTHLAYLDSLRAIAALYVVLHHAAIQDVHHLDFTGFKRKYMMVFAMGHMSVNLFIVLSGFCLMLPIIRSKYELADIYNFYKRRVIRIIPPYYFAIGISLLLIYFFIGQPTKTAWKITMPVTPFSIVTHLALIHDLFLSTVYKINSVFWSISVEFRIYILFPVMVYIWKKKGPFATLLFAIAVTVIIEIVMGGLKGYYADINLGSSGVSPYIILFTLGMIAADISFSDTGLSTYKNNMPWGWAVIISFIIVAVLFYVRVLPKIHYDIIVKDIIFGVFSFCLLVYSSNINQDSTVNNFYKRFMSWRPLVFVGTFAYSLYLIHSPLQQVISLYIMPLFHLSRFNATLVLQLLSCVLIIPAAYIFFLLFEKPFMKMGKKKKVAVVA